MAIFWFLLLTVSAITLYRRRKPLWKALSFMFFVFTIVSFFHGSIWFDVIALILAGGYFYAKYRQLVKKKRPTLPIAAAVLIAALIGGGVALASLGGSPTAATASPDQQLQVTNVTYDCPVVTTDKTSAKRIGAMQSDRNWSDAVSTPFKATKPATMVAEVQRTVCTDPLYGAMVANYFANLTVDGTKIVDLNPWLKEFQGKQATTISDAAARYLPADNASDKQKQATNKRWKNVADKIDTLLGKFVVGGVHSDPSVLNYHLTGDGLTAGNLPAISLNHHQESLSAVQLYLTAKGQTQCTLKIGFNTGDSKHKGGDKRLEQFKCSTPPKPPAHPSTPGTPGHSSPPGSPTCHGNRCVTTTPPSGCKTGCTTSPPTSHTCPPSAPHGTWPVCKDDAGHMPSGTSGNGKNEDSGPGSPNPKPTFPTSPRTNPSTPKSQPTHTRTTAPPEDNSSEPATGCAPAPGQHC